MSAQAISDIAILESQGIASQLKGDMQADSHQVVAGTVELQVSDSDFSAADRLLTTADRERFEKHVSPQERRKMIGRYFKVALATFIAGAALFAWKAPELISTVGGCVLIAVAAAGFATFVGFSAAVLDL